MISYADLSEDRPKRKRKHAVRVVERLIPDSMLEAYKRERHLQLGKEGWRAGWPHPTSYMHVSSMLEIGTFRPLTELLAEEIGEEMGLHLTLTGFQSTQRNWHSDQYLNPPGVADSYLAVWIACDDIHPDSGPFEWVPGSEQWPIISRQKVFEHAFKLGLNKTDKWQQDWPNLTQDFVSQACEAEIVKRGAQVLQFMAKKGDVLIWDSDLIHRGSAPKNPALERPALICHYSAISKRPDMPKPVKHINGSWYFPIHTKGTY